MLAVGRIIGHKEWAGPRKSDPRHSMPWRRDRVARFQPRGQVHAVTGAIKVAYDRLLTMPNGSKAPWGFFLGKALGPAVVTWGGDAYWQEFERGVIYAHSGKAFVVWGDIKTHWWSIGAEKSIGYPISDELTCPDGIGKFQNFQSRDPHRAAIYWSPATKAHLVKGLIGEEWGRQGWETGFLGYPLSGEIAAEGGLVQQFQGGSILYKDKILTVRTK